MSIQIGSKVKIKANTEPGYYIGATGTVIAEGDDGWEWEVQIDHPDVDIDLFYNADELEAVK